MKILVSIFLHIACFTTLCAQATGTVRPGRDLIPLLPYVFFDSGSAVIPSRYLLFTSREQTKTFSEHAIHGDALELHHNMLNILGDRLRRYPAAKVTIGGYNTTQPEVGETKETARARAEAVRDYLIKIWGITPSRLELISSGGLPRFVSNLKDPFSIQENRRVEILTDDWQITRPILRERVASPGVSGPPLDVYWIVRFTFDSPQAGELNERILREYLYRNISPGDTVTAIGWSDVNVLSTRSTSLPMERTSQIIRLIRKNVDPAVVAEIKLSATRSHDLLFPRGLPEAGFYNRCVLVRVE